MELFAVAQCEKDSRTNIQINNDGSTQSKTTRYNAQNVLSGLLVCAEFDEQAVKQTISQTVINHVGKMVLSLL